MIFLLLTIAIIGWLVSRQKVRALQKKLQPITSADKYIEVARKTGDSLVEDARKEAENIKAEAILELNRINQRIKDLGGEAERRAEEINREMEAKQSQALVELKNTRCKINAAREEAKEAREQLERINQMLALVSDSAYLIDVGYYEPRYEFEDLPRYEVELKRLRDKQKQMLREDGTGVSRQKAAAYATASLTFNGSSKDGIAAQKKTLKLMLRAFNGEVDSFISRVNYRNIEAMKKRIESAYSSINAITEKFDQCLINKAYLNLKLDELSLVYEYEEQKQREREEQARIREQMREDEKVRKEVQRKEKQAEEEEKKYKDLLEKAQKEAVDAVGQEKDVLASRVAELERQLSEAKERKERAISQAQLTKAGHVYIISNIGSFGENVFKIGMTRRDEPKDRVRELGDASVPFPFDIHALIPTSDAPALENALHKHFEKRKVNLENDRKEFFRASINEIKEELEKVKEELGIEAELRLTLLAEAKEYRLSEAKRKHLGWDG